MSSLGSPNPFFIAGKKAYEVERSLRFNDDDTAYLSRTPSSAGDRKKWTFSAWIKRGVLDNTMRIFGGNGNASHIFFYANNVYWDLAPEQSGTSAANLVTQKKFRDVGAWFHLVCALDTDESTANNRMRIYINGEEVTTFSSRSNPSSGYANNAINNNTLHTIGYRTSGQGSAGIGFDGYMAEINFIDGQQYDASYFGETNPITGQWNPKKYTGSYGTNGFYLNFSDNSGTTATTLGKDSSGNGNNFTLTNFNTHDSMLDSPTNNFCTLNLLDDDYNGPSTFSEANLFASRGGSDHGSMRGTMGMSSGKWYFEYCLPTATNGSASSWNGVCNSTADMTVSRTDGMWNYGGSNGEFIVRGSGNSSTYNFGSAISAGTVIGMAVDMDNKKIWLGKNNTWFGSSNADTDGNPSTGANPTDTFTDSEIPDGNLYPQMGLYNYANKANFGQDSTFSGTKTRQGNTDANGKGDFFYAPPTGFKALCSANLPDPTIKLPNKHFDTLLYTGNGSSQTLSGLNFVPDWVWIKIRSQSYDHAVFDTIRGATKDLEPNQTGAEQTRQMLTAFTSDGFSVGNDTQANKSGDTFVAWNWNAGDTDGKTYTVTVVSDSGNKYRFDGYGTSAVTLDLAEGGTYIFNYPSAHPFRFSTTADGTHGGGSEYTTGVTVLSSTSIQIIVAASAPTLYYYCTQHSGMGGAINTNSTLGSSNFDGTIQTTVKVNATAGFSVTTYSGTDTGSSQTLGHGLGVAPKLWIFKNRSSTGNWVVYTTAIDGGSDYLTLNSNNASASGVSPWDTAPTSSVITVGTNNADTCNAGDNYVLYAFSEVEGYSKFGSFTGNGLNNGPFIHLGFSPALIIYKNASAGSTDWLMFDPKRIHDGTNLDYVEPNTSDTEGYLAVDLLSNGFKLTHETNSKFNGSGNKFIYLAFAESPFKNARAR